MSVSYEIPPVETVEWLRPPELEGVPIPDHYVRPSIRDAFDITNENKLIVSPDHDALTAIAPPVTQEEIESGQVEEWFNTLYEALKVGGKQRAISGMAGPQAGISKRLVLANLNENPKYSPDEKLTELINPWTEDVDDEMYDSSEGCFSVWKIGGPVRRPVRTILHADNLPEPIFLEDDPSNGRNQRGRTVRHEEEHLGKKKNGKLIPGTRVPDKIIAAIERGEATEADLRWIHAEHVGLNPEGGLNPYSQMQVDLRNGKQVQPWPEQYWLPPDQWLAIKAGQILMPRVTSL